MRKKYVLGLAVFILGLILTLPISSIPESQRGLEQWYWWEMEERKGCLYSYLIVAWILLCVVGVT